MIKKRWGEKGRGKLSFLSCIIFENRKTTGEVFCHGIIFTNLIGFIPFSLCPGTISKVFSQTDTTFQPFIILNLFNLKNPEKNSVFATSLFLRTADLWRCQRSMYFSSFLVYSILKTTRCSGTVTLFVNSCMIYLRNSTTKLKDNWCENETPFRAKNFYLI